MLADDRADHSKQLQFLQILGEVRQPECVPVVLRLACQSSDNALRICRTGHAGHLRRPVIGAESSSLMATCLMMFWRPHKACLVATKMGGPISGRRSRPRRSIRARPAGRRGEAFALGDAEIVARATKLFGPIKPATSAELRAHRPARRHDSRRFRRAQAGPADLRPAMSALPYAL